MNKIPAECVHYFPLYRMATATEWTLPRRGSWLGGFLAGVWKRRAAIIRNKEDYEMARVCTARLKLQLYDHQAQFYFLLWRHYQGAELLQ